MIFSGAPPADYRHEAGTVFFTVPITRRFSSFACIRRFSTVKVCRLPWLKHKTSGRSATSPSWSRKNTSIATETQIIKFFLHLSTEEQRKAFLERLDVPEKNWKFSVADIKERKLWDHYMKAYEACLSATSTSTAPWHVVPADDKKNARLIISRIILDTLQSLKMS